MSRIYRVSASGDIFHVKADSAELAEQHIIDEYEDLEVAHVFMLPMRYAEDIAVSDEDGKEFSNLREVFEESTRNPDVLTVPAGLL